jgi:hypothetical protein
MRKKAMKIFLYVSTLFLFGACALNATQEQKLNESLAGYLFGRNECQVVSYVAFTYPELVATYKAQGDSIFKQQFDCNEDSLYFQDPTVRLIQKEGEVIHVLYDLTVFNKNTSERYDKKHELIALSSDSGKSWFFMDKSKYVDKSLLPKLKRLIDK